MNAPLLLCAVLLFGVVLGIVIGAHLATTGRVLGRRRQDAPAALTSTSPAALAAVLREHAELAAVLRELADAPPASASAVLPAVRELPAGGDR